RREPGIPGVRGPRGRAGDRAVALGSTRTVAVPRRGRRAAVAGGLRRSRMVGQALAPAAHRSARTRDRAGRAPPPRRAARFGAAGPAGAGADRARYLGPMGAPQY